MKVNWGASIRLFVLCLLINSVLVAAGYSLLVQCIFAFALGISYPEETISVAKDNDTKN